MFIAVLEPATFPSSFFNAVAHRWLRTTVKATSNAGLTGDEAFYTGHLLKEQMEQTVASVTPSSKISHRCVLR